MAQEPSVQSALSTPYIKRAADGCKHITLDCPVVVFRAKTAALRNDAPRMRDRVAPIIASPAATPWS